ncbi:MAG TPA: hypothetical protein VJ648_11905 [Vicinamibacteria bacterium]|nr:hypothetical protein [Vicinamibacteria bacterium]
MRKLNRRQFTQEASLGFLAGVTVSVSSCGGGGGGGDYQSPTGGGGTTATPPPAPTGSKSGQVSANHGHQAVITAAQLQAGGAIRLDIATAEAGHSHIVDLPAQAVQEIRDGRPVQKDSTTTDAHMHTVTFNAEAPEEPSRY